MAKKKVQVDEHKRRLLRNYVLLWCSYQLLLDWKFGGLAKQGPYEALQLGLVLLTSFIDSRILTVVTFLVRCVGLVARMPNTFDSEYLEFITNLTVGLAVLLDATEYLPQVMRLELGIFYMAAAFWKINTAFLDPKYSCGTTYAVQMFCMLGVPSFFVKDFVSFFGVLTIVLEGSIGLFALFRRTGVLSLILCLALHVGITLTPPPNNIAGFGVVALVRFFWLLPAPRIPFEVALFWAVPSAAVFLGATHVLHTQEGQVQYVESTTAVSLDWPAGIFGAVAAVMGVALICADKKEGQSPYDQTQEKRKPLRKAFIVGGGAALMALWSFGAIMLGILDGASPNMFSNIRMSGGSNHFLLPTSLLQQWYYHDPASVYGGGILRIEASNSTTLNGIHPGELTSVLSSETRRVLKQELGYSGRFFNSLVANVVGAHVMPPSNDPPRYTLPAFEVHRVLRLAIEEGPVEITVTKLDGPTGDETWRRHSGNRTVTLVFSPSYPQLASCKLHQNVEDQSNDESDCEHSDLFYLTFLAAEESKSWINFVGGKLQMWNSYIIYDNDDDDTELHCYGS